MKHVFLRLAGYGCTADEVELGLSFKDIFNKRFPEWDTGRVVYLQANSHPATACLAV